MSQPTDVHRFPSILSLTVLLSGLVACAPPERATLRPRLAFTMAREEGMHAARDLTVDREGNVYIFDYDDYAIRKFALDGALLVTFGGTGEEPGRFRHLMAIRARGDSLVAIDEGSLSVFAPDGAFRFRRAFADTVVCDYPRLRPDGRWAAEWFIEETAEQALTYRNVDGTERDRPASLSLTDLYGITPGETFFVNRTQAPAMLYDFLADGRLVWMVSDRPELMVDADRRDEILYELEASAVRFPEEEIAALRQRRAGLSPPLFMNVPDHYQIVHHLLVDESGDIWLYVMSNERTGFLRLTPLGREIGFFDLVAPFDPLEARITAANGRLYFLVPGRAETAVYFVDVP
ncbi:MAG: hypothetical protein PVH00_05880 [Gemmatimonadota bacterium]|jgi:hypothetical protein